MNFVRILTGLNIWRLVGVAGSLAVGGALAGDSQTPAATAASAATADQSGLPVGFSSWEEVMDAQLPLSLAATELATFLGVSLPSRGVEPVGFAGFAEITIDIPAGLVALYWRGPVPSNVGPYLSQLESKHRIRTKVLAARFSRAEFDGAREAVMADAASRAMVNMIGPIDRYSRMVVHVDDPQAAAMHSGFLIAAQKLNALAPGVNPVVFHKGVKAVVVSRNDDSAPWWGGARIKINGGSCTSGFSVQGPGFPSALPYMLTAWHCLLQNYVAVTDGVGQAMGQSWGTQGNLAPSTDSALVANIGTNTNRIYTGGTGGVGELHMPVVGLVGNFVGNLVCQSGASSGEICGILVENTNISCSTSTQSVHPCVQATKSGGGAAVSPGDSGGPVYIKSGSNVLGAGVTSAKNGNTFVFPCPGLGVPGCSPTMFYIDLNNALYVQGVNLRTAP